MKKLSRREIVLLILSVLCVLFYFYWQFLLNPLLKSMDETRAQTKSLQLQLEERAFPLAKAQAGKEAFKIFSKDEQLNRILKFIDKKFKSSGIKLISLRQSAENKKLTLNLKFKSNSFQLSEFLNALPQLKTVLIIDNVSVAQEGAKLVVEMRLLSAYR